MNDTFQPLPQLQIATPCPKSWDQMSGDDQSRFCSHCEKSVFNFSEMTTCEVQEVLNSNASVCARMRRRKDGSIVTRDCRTQPHAINRRDWMSQFFSLASMFLAMGAFLGCNKRSALRTEYPENMGIVAPEQGELMGDVVEIPPPTMGEVDVNAEDESHPVVGKVVTPVEFPPDECYAPE